MSKFNNINEKINNNEENYIISDETYNKNIINKTCNHYDNKLQIFASCCKKYYDCHLCHNESNNHQVNRQTIKKIKCITCAHENSVSEECISCKTKFAKFSCKKCNIWCSKITNSFHCNDCGICRQGKKEDYFHCNGCNICLSINCKDNHKCSKLDNNADCLICFNSLFLNINDSVVILPCNHLIHKNCLEELRKNSHKSNKIPSCMICRKSVNSHSLYESIYDNYIINNPLPSYYDNWIAEILCNDCCIKSNTKYHTKYIKCIECKSYNTTLINKIIN
jgi:uncharacterized CHY-type Zn-finger protein